MIRYECVLCYQESSSNNTCQQSKRILKLVNGYVIQYKNRVMTRINCGIPPPQLRREHLIAEHREIVRIPNSIKDNKAKIKDIPNEFKLGIGHVKFFYNKLRYLWQRYSEIYQECIRRGYNVTYYGSAFNELPSELYNDYIPKKMDIHVVKERILIRSNCTTWEEYMYHKNEDKINI